MDLQVSLKEEFMETVRDYSNAMLVISVTFGTNNIPMLHLSKIFPKQY